MGNGMIDQNKHHLLDVIEGVLVPHRVVDPVHGDNHIFGVKTDTDVSSSIVAHDVSSRGHL